jgi:mRNA (guanine-N7-)-methyltransferase
LRHRSTIFHLRNINNWIKTALIEHAISNYHVTHFNKQSVRAIDFGCGKGGDLDKWVKNKSSDLETYVGVDYAKSSLEDFAGRVASMAAYNPTAAAKVKMLVFADMGNIKENINSSQFETYSPATKLWSKSVPCPVEKKEKFTIASCQFAMHYMFQDESRANHFFRQVSSNLELNGVLIATTVDSRVVADQAVKVDSESDPSKERDYKKNLSVYADSENKGDDSSSSQPSLMMNLHFDDNNWSRLLNTEDSNNNSAFGIRYVFTLKDAVDVPEWLVPTGGPLRDLAAAHGLEVVMCQNFHDFVHDKMTTDISLR